MKFLDREVIYLCAAQNATKDEIEELKSQHGSCNRTVVILREGKLPTKTILTNLLNASLK